MLQPPEHRQLTVDESEKLRLSSAKAPSDRESDAGRELSGAAGRDSEVISAVLASATTALGGVEHETLGCPVDLVGEIRIVPADRLDDRADRRRGDPQCQLTCFESVHGHLLG
jgi:hypothetical protein